MKRPECLMAEANVVAGSDEVFGALFTSCGTAQRSYLYLSSLPSRSDD